MAAIDLPIAVAACLVARRAKSVVRRSSATSSGTSPDLYPGLSADQPGKPEAPPSCATKRQPDLLLRMPCHLSEMFPEGLRWQGRSLKRGCLAHGEIAGQRLFHRGHPLIAVFTHPLHVSITGMLKLVYASRKRLFPFPLNLRMEIWKMEGSLELGDYGQKDNAHRETPRGATILARFHGKSSLPWRVP